MKGKKEYIILAVIIVAVGAYLVFRPTDRSTYQLPVLAEVAENEITKIEIIVSRKPTVINRKGDDWLVGPEEYPADPEKIERMLDTVADLTLTAMVSESKSDQRYDLTPEKRIQVKAWAGKDLKREFDVGKTADTFRHTFVKVTGDDRVFHAEIISGTASGPPSMNCGTKRYWPLKPMRSNLSRLPKTAILPSLRKKKPLTRINSQKSKRKKRHPARPTHPLTNRLNG